MHTQGSPTLQPQVKFTKIINLENHLADCDQDGRSVTEDHPCDWCKRNLNTRDEILPAIEELLSLLEAAGYSRKERFAIHLSLEEALVNAIKHGHGDDPGKEVRLRYLLRSDYLLAEIEDQGPGFRLKDVPDPFAPENRERPCGRGLLLMQNYMTWVRFNDIGNCVTLCRRRFSA